MPHNAPPQSSLILYQTEDGRTRIECRFQDDTIWLTQALIAELFQVVVPTVNEHLKGIFAELSRSRNMSGLLPDAAPASKTRRRLIRSSNSKTR